MNIPSYLIDQIKTGGVILFLGSGASKGATHNEGKSPPDANQLADLLSDKFLGTPTAKFPLSRVAELAISESDLFTVQNFIHSLFIDFYPADFHKAISEFSWPAIASTNYDLILERAYDQVQNPCQQLVVFKQDGERIEEKIRTNNSVIYLKLHGCITDTNNKDIPLILTPDQYITHRKGRRRLFERLHSLAYEYPILFIGYTLSDEDIRSIILELDELGDAKPRSYFIAPTISEEESRFWETKKITSIKCTFKKFIDSLCQEIPKEKRALANFSVTTEKHPVFSRLKVSEKRQPSENFLNFITSEIDYLHKSFKVGHTQPGEFYRGFFVDWDPIILEYDVKRTISDDIISEIILSTEEEKQSKVEFYLIKGHAGSGKSVILKRIAWDASVEFDKLCIFVKTSASLRYESILELFRLYGDRIFLFFDTVSESKEIIEQIIYRARQDKILLTIIATERNGSWNTSCQNVKNMMTDEYVIQYLSQKEIVFLIEKLEKYNSLGDLEGKSKEEQIKALSNRAGRQLLVALHEATLGKPFSDIIFDEYNSINDKNAQALYLTVCIMHRLGVPTRAGLISRVHHIPFRLFKEELFAPLEHIVFTKKHERLNDFNYITRHPYIAERVFERVLITQQERFDEYIRIIDALDIDYKTDFDSLCGLLNARHLLLLFTDHQMIRQIYQCASNRFGEKNRLLQQEAIFEMKSKGGSLDKATSLLTRAHNNHPNDKAIKHSLSELALRKSKKSKNELEKAKYRSDAKRLAAELIERNEQRNAHPYHTLIKIGLDELSEYLSNEDIDKSVLHRQVASVEKYISSVIQKFPGEELVYKSESDFHELLNNHSSAIKSLEKSFNINKRNPFTAIRLSKLYNKSGYIDKAFKVLRECLDYNPGEKKCKLQSCMFARKKRKNH